MLLVCCCCGCISEHLFTGKSEVFGKITYHKFRCVDCQSAFYIAVEGEKVESVVFIPVNEFVDNLLF